MIHGWPSTQPNLTTHNPAAHHRPAHNHVAWWCAAGLCAVRLGCVECPAYGWRTQPCSTPPSHGVVCSSVTCCRVVCRSGKIGLFGVSPNKLLNKQSNWQRFETPCHYDLPWYTMKEVTGCENRSYMFLSNHLTKRSFFLQNGLRYLLTHFPKIDTHFDLRSFLLHSLKTSWCQLCRQWWHRRLLNDLWCRQWRQSWLHDN